MKVPFSETFSSDPKVSANNFRAELGRLGLVPMAAHHFMDFMDPVQGGAMCNHHQAVCIPKVGQVSGPSATAGPSCTVGRRVLLPAAAPEDDLSVVALPGAAKKTTLGIVSAFLSLLPRTFLIESAAGLAEADLISAALGERYHIAILEMALGMWVEVERSRPVPQALGIVQGRAREEWVGQGCESEFDKITLNTQLFKLSPQHSPN